MEYTVIAVAFSSVISLVGGGYLSYRYGRDVENKALNAIRAAQLAAVTFGKTANSQFLQ